MQPQAHTPHPATEEELSTGALGATAEKAGVETESSNVAGAGAVVEVELNFNAFADHVPPTQHARRAATHFDPSIQDFADQALEVAALRAELKRLSRDCDALRNTVRLRESLVQTLREQLSSLRAPASADLHVQEAQSVTPESPRAPVPVATTLTDCEATAASEHAKPSAQEASVVHSPPAEHDGSSTVVLETTALDDCAATITDVQQMTRDPGALDSAPGRKLLPEGHEGQAILLNRDIITIGRMRQSDVCIPSRAVSRDHARLVVGASSVTLFDMGSANGCFVNNEPIKRHKLRSGDLVRIGDRSYRFVDHVRSARTFTAARADS
jgi:hypothetical protein